MRWLYVIIFALLAGVYTGIMMQIPALNETSFQDIGISYEWWVIFAVILVVNCEKSWEGMLKCFVFFLISQPIVYLVEILGGSLTFEMGKYYYFNGWFQMTLLTLPGGLIAYFCKKQNVLGAVILGLGNTIQAVLGVYYISAMIRNFPHHLLSAVVCAASVIIMSLTIQKEKRGRIISIAVPVVLVLILIVAGSVTGTVVF